MPAIQNPLAVTIVAMVCLMGCPKGQPPGARRAAQDAGRSVAELGSAAGGDSGSGGHSPIAPVDDGGRGLRPERAQEIAACVDRWLGSKGLNQYGNAPGSMYMGGTPLFDERTGKRVDRVALVLRKHPLLRSACSVLDSEYPGSSTAR